MGIDSSAAQAIIKLRDSLTNQFGIKLSIFVPGTSEGFPCEINLSEKLNSRNSIAYDEHLSIANGRRTCDKGLLEKLTGSSMCENMDEALIYAEVRRSLIHTITFLIAITLNTPRVLLRMHLLHWLIPAYFMTTSNNHFLPGSKK